LPIFTRRDVQRELDSLVGALSSKQLRDLTHKLNGKNSSVLATEWEVVILSSLAKCGRIEYEKDLGGKTRPDILFTLGEDRGFKFLADITTVSDEDARAHNSYEELWELIRKFLKKREHTSAGLRLEVQHERTGKYGKSKLKLLLPKKGSLQDFVKTELGPFLCGVAREPEKNTHFAYDGSGVRLAMIYNSREKRYSGGSHVDFTVPYAKARNPLATALESKGGQLSNSGYDGPCGIIVCDGGYNALRQERRSADSYGCQDIVEAVLRKRKRVLFVLVLYIEESHFLATHNLSVKSKLYWNPAREKTLHGQLAEVSRQMISYLPHPESSPHNAIRWLTNEGRYSVHQLGGYTMQGNTIKISSRSLTELLAGKIDINRFRQLHGFSANQAGEFVMPFFEHQLKCGRTVKTALVENEPHKDDDWIVLHYEGPDPSLSPFRYPA
jgi:hypothetical protein